MANQILTRQEITREPLMMLENNLKIVPAFRRDLSQEFGKKGAKIGDTIYVLKPQRFIGRDGQAYQPEAMIDTQVPITINQQSGVDFEMSTADKYLSIDQFKVKTLDKASASLANKLDFRAAQSATVNIAQTVGNPGITPGFSATDAFQIYAQAGEKLDNSGFPLTGENRRMIINPRGRIGWITNSKEFFNPTNAIGKQYKTGQISDALSYDWFVDQNIIAQTLGLFGGTPAVNGANQTGTNLTVDGMTGNIVGWGNIGDVFQIAGVYEVNPQSRQSTGTLQDFVLQAPVNTDGGGAATFVFTPAIVPSGPFQNVSNAPADNALISMYSTAAAGQAALSGISSPQYLLLTDECMAFCSFPGDVPDGVDMGYVENDPDIGVSLRFIRIYDGVRDMWINRFDVYYGMGPLYQEGGVRIAA